MKYLFIASVLILSLVFSASSVLAASANATIPGATSTFSSANEYGAQFTAKNNITIEGAIKFTGDGAETCRIAVVNGPILATGASFSGTYCAFNQTVEIDAGTYFAIVADSSGSTTVHYHNANALPYDMNIVWLNGSGGVTGPVDTSQNTRRIYGFQYFNTTLPTPVVTAELFNNVTGASIGTTTFNNISGALTFDFFNITSSGFCVTYTGNGTGTNCTASGSGANTYYNVSETVTVAGGTRVNASTYQSLANLNAYRLFLNTNILSFNATNNLVTNQTTTGILLLPLNDGSNNVQVNVAGNYSLNLTITGVSLQTINATANGIHDNKFTVYANTDGDPVNTFNATVTNTTLSLTNTTSTTTGTIIFNLLQGYEYTFNVSSFAGFNANVTTLQANASTNTFNATLDPITLTFLFLDELNRSMIGSNVSVGIITSDNQQSGYSTTTGNLTLIGDFPPGDYTVRYGAPFYSTRDYYFTLTENDQIITLYMISSDEYSPGTVEVKGTDGLPIDGATIQLRRYYGDPTLPTTVQYATTNSDGYTVMVAESVTGFYLWTVTYNDIIYINTTVPELLVLDNDGLWHKTFVLPQSASDAANRNTGFLYDFTPTQSQLQNGTSYNFTTSISSGYWEITGCVYWLTNESGTVLAGPANSFCGTTGGTERFTETTPQTGRLTLHLNVSTLYFTNQYQTTYQVYKFSNESFTLKDLADDLTNFDGAGFGGFSRFLISVTAIVLITVGVVNKSGIIGAPEETLLLIFVLTLPFSYIGWLTIPLPTISSPELQQWFLSLALGIMTLITSVLRKTGATQ